MPFPVQFEASSTSAPADPPECVRSEWCAAIKAHKAAQGTSRFQQIVIERLAVIETKLDALRSDMNERPARLGDLILDTLRPESSDDQSQHLQAGTQPIKASPCTPARPCENCDEGADEAIGNLLQEHNASIRSIEAAGGECVAPMPVFHSEVTTDVAPTRNEPSPRSSMSSAETGMQVGPTLSQEVTNLMYNSEAEGGSLTRTILIFLEDPLSSFAATMYKHIMFVFTLFSVLVPMLQTLDPPLFSHATGFAIEASVDTVFLVEFLVHFLVHPSRCRFMRAPTNIFNMTNLAVLPLRIIAFTLLDAADNEIAQIIILCIVPVFRLLKALRYFPNLRLVSHALSLSSIALTVPLFLLLVMLLVFSIALYLVEPRSNIQSVPHAVYLAVITLTTVGYGDVSPVTDPGKILCCMLAMCGLIYMAMPISIVGDAFNRTWKDRGRIILIGRTRERLIEWGYSDTHLDRLFGWFDRDGSGSIDCDEFAEMIGRLRLGLSKSSTLQLFEHFDKDQSGEIDLVEFKTAMSLPKVGQLTHTGRLTRTQSLRERL